MKFINHLPCSDGRNMISSSDNKQVKNVVLLNNNGKARKKQNVFIVEGIRMFLEVETERIVSVFVSESFALEKENEHLLERVHYEVVEDKIFYKMSDTQTPQGILAIIQKKEYSVEDMVLSGNQGCILFLEGIQDPGNLGTMIRSGEGAGISGVIMSKDTVDIFNPKTIRSTMGSIYRVPHLVSDDFLGCMREFQKKGGKVYATHLLGKYEYHELDYANMTGILIGNEGKGLTKEAVEQADEWVRIPMEGQVESLNASIAAALFMYEVKRKK